MATNQKVGHVLTIADIGHSTWPYLANLIAKGDVGAVEAVWQDIEPVILEEEEFWESEVFEEENAQDYVFGYCIVNDISERSWQKERGGQWIKGKSIAGPTGPYLVTKDEIKNLNNINLALDVNDNRRQTGNTERMIFNFNFLISHLSQFMTLYPGTIITTGTPAGTAMEMKKPEFLKAGDKLHLKVDGLGEQFHEIIDE